LPPAATTAARILCVVGALRTISFVLPAMLAGLGHAGDALLYQALAAVALPAAFAGAAAIAPDHGYVVVAWAWAVAYPVVFGVLLGRSLARCHLQLASYLRGLSGVLACGAGAAAVALAVHELLPPRPLGRLLAVAVAVIAVYAGMLARIEKITPRSILRAVRGVPDGADPEQAG
jgi:O-antigen/teichoic acid export membrane protein